MLHTSRIRGGIKTVKQAGEILNRGVEKVVLNTSAIENPSIIRELADQFGSQSVVVSIDVRKNFLGNYQCFTYSGKTKTGRDPKAWAMEAEQAGAGEIFLNSIDRDGTMTGYDIPLIKRVSENVSIPVIACGGAGNLLDFGKAIHDGGASAVSAGSLFVFHGKFKAVLINFPSDDELKKVMR